MTRERVLAMTLEEAIDAFQAIKWKFFSDEDADDRITIDVPRGPDERFVVEIPYMDERERSRIIDVLYGADFIRQVKRVTTEW